MFKKAFLISYHFINEVINALCQLLIFIFYMPGHTFVITKVHKKEIFFINKNK